MSDLFSQLEKQIAQDFLDKKTDAIYDCSEIYSLIEHKDREIEERDRKILQLNHDYNESTDELKREIEERDQKIINLEREIEELKKGMDWRTLKDERDLNFVELQGENNSLTTEKYRLEGRLSILSHEINRRLNLAIKHLNSLEIDLGLLGSWTKDDYTGEWVTHLTHAQKANLSKRKIRQVEYLSELMQESLKLILEKGLNRGHNQSEF